MKLDVNLNFDSEVFFGPDLTLQACSFCSRWGYYTCPVYLFKYTIDSRPVQQLSSNGVSLVAKLKIFEM